MNKVLRYFVMTVMALCLSIPCFGSSVEAATIALLPLVNNAQDDLAGKVFYKEAIAAINSQKGLMMVENKKLDAAIAEANVTTAVPSESDLAKIAKDGDVDIVIAIQLDKLDSKTIYSSEENKLEMNIKGYAVAFNRLTGEFYEHRIYNDNLIPEVFSSRWDVAHEEWGKTVRYEVKRAISHK